jgi:hypothetical protein
MHNSLVLNFGTLVNGFGRALWLSGYSVPHGRYVYSLIEGRAPVREVFPQHYKVAMKLDRLTDTRNARRSFSPGAASVSVDIVKPQNCSALSDPQFLSDSESLFAVQPDSLTAAHQRLTIKHLSPVDGSKVEIRVRA